MSGHHSWPPPSTARDKKKLERYLLDEEWCDESRMAVLKALAVGGLPYSTTKCVIALIDYALAAVWTSGIEPKTGAGELPHS